MHNNIYCERVILTFRNSLTFSLNKLDKKKYKKSQHVNIGYAGMTADSKYETSICQLSRTIIIWLGIEFSELNWWNRMFTIFSQQKLHLDWCQETLQTQSIKNIVFWEMLNKDQIRFHEEHIWNILVLWEATLSPNYPKNKKGWFNLWMLILRQFKLWSMQMWQPK